MPETQTTDVRELRDWQLVEVARSAEATVTEVREKVSAGTATRRDYDAGTEAARERGAIRAEQERRAANRTEPQSMFGRIGLRRHPLTLARQYDPDVLDGVALDADRLSDDDLAELRRHLRARREGELSEEGRARAELLVGQAAGEPELYARRRRELAREESMRAEATTLARTFLPRRRDPEPGSVELPRYLLDWLTNGEPDTFDVTDLGVLAALALSFANEDASVLARADFAHDADGPRIVVRQAGAGARLTRGADDSQHLQLADHLGALKRNGWIETERVRGTYTIRPGERMRKLWPKPRG
jgi:hypothetical protein